MTMMKMNYFITFFIIGLSCANPSSQSAQTKTKNSFVESDTNYTWTKLLYSAEWQKSYNFKMFSIQNTFWTFLPDGNGFSKNGLYWKKSILGNSILNLAFFNNYSCQ